MTIRPFVVEFTGTPEAGKTTTIKQILPLLEHSLDWVREYNNLFEQFLSSISVPIFSMDTTGVPQDIVVKAITSTIVGGYENFLHK